MNVVSASHPAARLLFRGTYEDLERLNRQKAHDLAEKTRWEEKQKQIADAFEKQQQALAKEREVLSLEAGLRPKQLAVLSEVLDEYDGIKITGKDALDIIDKRCVGILQKLRLRRILGCFVMAAMATGGGRTIVEGLEIMGALLGGAFGFLITSPFTEGTEALRDSTDAQPLKQYFETGPVLKKLAALQLVALQGSYFQAPMACHNGRWGVEFQGAVELTPRGKALLKEARQNNLGAEQQRIEQLARQVRATQTPLPEFVSPKPVVVGGGIRVAQVSALLKKNETGLNGFEVLQQISKRVSSRLPFNKTVSTQTFARSLGMKTVPPKLLEPLEQAGYLVRCWSWKDSNPKYRLTQAAQELVQYESVGALKDAGKITKADEKAFLQAEIDMWWQQHKANDAWLAQLEETHTHPPYSNGEDREVVLQERQNQLELGRNFAQKNRQAISEAIGELAHSLDLLDLNEVNVQLRELATRPEQVAREIQERLGTVLRENEEEYFTNRALLSPEEQQAKIKVEERIQERLLANATAKAMEFSEPPASAENTVALPSSRTLKIPDQPMAESQQS